MGDVLESTWGRPGATLGRLDPEGPTVKVIFNLSGDKEASGMASAKALGLERTSLI